MTAETLSLDDALMDAGTASPVSPPTSSSAPPERRGPGRPRKTAADKAPSKPAGSPRPPGRPPLNNLRGRLTEQIAAIGVAVAIVNPTDGAAVLAGAEPLASALEQLARENDGARRALERMLAASAWGAVLTAVAGIAIPILANHELLPAAAATVLSPTTVTPDA